LITPEPAAYGEPVASSPSPATTAADAGTDTDADADKDVSAHCFLKDLGASLSAGIKLVQLRSKLLTPITFSALAKQAAILCHQAGARLIVNGALATWESAEKNIVEGERVAIRPASGSYSDAFYSALQADIDALGADGIHLSSAHLMRCSQRPLRREQWVSAACHTAAELQQAVTLQLDFVTLSPVLRTATHPDAEPLGWERFATLSRVSHAASMPIFALGGMQAADMPLARAHGAHGIAAIRSFWVHSPD
jgi:thiamine monophosphate synthase